MNENRRGEGENLRVRKTKFELLRIICMLFVITEHLLPNISDIQNISAGFEYYIANIVRSFCIVAVNCFVLLSGYFGIKMKVKRIFRLDAVVWFWGITGLVLATVTGMNVLQVKKDILYLFPIITKRNWFVTTYIVLYLISPILNFVIEKLNKRQFQSLILLLVSIFYFIPTIDYTLNAPTVTLDSGYGIVNFVCLYFIGRYINLYLGNIKKVYARLGYFLSCILLFAANHIMSILVGFYFNTYISYDTIFCLAGAVSLFLWFRELHLQSQMINRIARYSFAAFIIHTSPFYGGVVYEISAKISANSMLLYIVVLVVTPVLVYGLSIGLEFIRQKLFRKMENMMITKITENKFVLTFENQMKEFNG